MAEVDLKKIFSNSKIFLSFSPDRRAQLVSAAQDPLNAELVQQLVSYLDPEYRSPEYVNPKKSDDKDISVDLSDDFGDAEEFGAEPERSAAPSRSPSPPMPPAPNLSGDFGDADEFEAEQTETELDVDDDVPGVNVVEDVPSAEDEISESTEIVSDEEKVKAIKDALDSENITSGVTRVVFRDSGNELWVYYNDNVNLNKIMSDVVDIIEKHGYSQLTFNRLARMDNAVVFEVNEAA